MNERDGSSLGVMTSDRLGDITAWTTPDGPDLTPIRLLHGHHDGSIPFMRKTSGDRFEPLGSIDARQLESVFPQYIAPLVEDDGFFGINGCLPVKFIHDYSKVEGLKDAKIRRAMWGCDHLRWLTACWVDLDFYKTPGMTLGRAVGAVIDLQDQGHVPPASMLVDSGRGLWAFWILRCADGLPIRAWPETTGTWNRIERSLIRKFHNIEPDFGAKDPARITRIPGSNNTKSARRVRYWLQADQHGQFITYRLEELAALLNVRCTKLSPKLRAAVDPKNRQKGIRGQQLKGRRRLDRLIQVIQSRGLVQEGCRNRTAALLAAFMHACKIEELEITENVNRFGCYQCSPPLTPGEVETSIKGRRKLGYISDHTIGDWLLLTEEESDLTGWPAKGAHDATTDAPIKAADKREHRHSLILNLIPRGSASVPTLEVIQGYLDQYGAGAARETIRKDLVFLGIIHPRRKKGPDPQAALIQD